MDGVARGSDGDYCSAFPDEGGHHYETHMKSGEPITVQICQLCRYINWEDLRQQLERLAFHGWV